MTMKTTTTFEIEIQRNNITPAQFLAYVRNRVDNKGGRYLRSDLDLAYFAAGKDLNFDIHHEEPEMNGLHEKSISKPYEMQTYLRYANGAVYNEICEFQFFDDKTGNGYYYLVNVVAEEDEKTEEEEETEAQPESGETKVGDIVRFRKEWCQPEEEKYIFRVAEITLNPVTDKETRRKIVCLNKTYCGGIAWVCDVEDNMIETIETEETESGEEAKEDEKTEETKTEDGLLTIQHLLLGIDEQRESSRSHWDKGVCDYAEMLLNNILNDYDEETIRKAHSADDFICLALTGADDWKDFVYSGCLDIYNEDIARTLCSPSELKKTDFGRKNPNSRETWLDVEARALRQAERRIRRAFGEVC